MVTSEGTSLISIILYSAASWDAAVINGITVVSIPESQTTHCCVASRLIKFWKVQCMNGIQFFPRSGVSKVRKSWNLCLVNLSVFSAICFDISYVLLVRPNHPNINCQHQHALFAINYSQLRWCQSGVAWSYASVFPWRFFIRLPCWHTPSFSSPNNIWLGNLLKLLSSIPDTRPAQWSVLCNDHGFSSLADCYALKFFKRKLLPPLNAQCGKQMKSLLSCMHYQ